MSRTFITQATQVFNSELYADNLVNGSVLSSSAASLEDDLNALRTQTKVLLFGTGSASGNWYSDLTLPTSGSGFGAITGSKRGVISMNQGLYNVENKNLLYRVENLLPIFVSASNTYTVLASSEAPTQTIALNDTVLGAVTALLPGDTGAWAATAVGGANAISPKNLVYIVTASNNDAINDANGREIYGLIQVRSSSIEGSSFDNLDNRAQISFVKMNATSDGLIQAASADIAGKTIHYAYVARSTYSGLPEDAFLSTNYTDFSSLVDITLATAVANQPGAFTATNSIDWKLAAGTYVAFETTGSVNTFKIAMDSQSTSTLSAVVDNFSITNTNAATFTKGATFNTSGNDINVGVTDGQIDAAAGLTIKAVSDLLLSGNMVTFADAYNAGSTYTGAMPFATASGEWNSFTTHFSNSTSVLGALNTLSDRISATASSRVVGTAVVTSLITSGTNATTSTNMVGTLPTLVGKTFSAGTGNMVNVYVNGVRQLNGVGNDVVAGDTLSAGDLKFNYNLRIGTVVQVDTF